MQTKDNASFHIVLVVGVLEKAGKFLLARRSPQEISAGGEWSVPGGKVEYTEKPEWGVLEKTLQEEFAEEVLVEVTNPHIAGNVTFVRPDGAHVLAVVFHCELVSGDPVPGEDTDEVAWMTYDEVRQKCPRYVVEYVEKAMECKRNS